MGRWTEPGDRVWIDVSMTTQRWLTLVSIVLIGVGFATLVMFLRDDRSQSIWLRASEACYLLGMLGLMFARQRVNDNSTVIAKWLALLSLLVAYAIVYIVI